MNGSAAGRYSLPATDITEFRGFVSDTPFTTFTLTTSATDSRQGIENVEALTSVPELAWTISAAALALLAAAPALARWKRGQRPA